eukprot:TRINITY_DN55022_c0_g1_i1.p1 TRINITY_DN55022_c0_g1~~TRINITY_DN55022_c0_g1_i1.p1  ORF type:complete len:481 (+),score=127.18 TRINITY_DN55022_c0_g1_i1:227-1669(+)
MFGGDNELGNMLQEAVKLKSAQIGQKRKTYETWPFFVQHTLFHMEKEHITTARQLPFAEKMEVAEKVKAEGNAAFGNKNWSEAVDKYEEAASLVYYCYSTDPGWRKNNRGIDDDVLVLVDDKGESDADAAAQLKLRLTCAVNIAACKLHLQKYEEVVSACTAALELDPKNVKALYRRAEARIRPARATAYDYDCAIKDLAVAHGLDPKNATVSRLLNDLRAERKVQRTKDQKTFTGMFERGEIYDGEGDPCLGLARDHTGALDGAEDIRSRIDNITDEDSLEKRTADAELLRDLYMRNGKEEEARELNEKIKAAKNVLKEREVARFDWDNPSPEMIADAQSHGLDITDPLIVAELKRVEAEELAKARGEPVPEYQYPPDGFASAGGASSSSAGAEGAPRMGSDLPLPQVEPGDPVPWSRYVKLFGGMFIFFRLFAVGLPRRILLLLLSKDGDPEAAKGSLLSVLYRQGISFLGLEDEAEL